MREIVLQNGQLRLKALPDLGGKLNSLVGLQDEREHLLQPPEFPWRPARYGAPFEHYDTSGFDECFPTVGECRLGDGTSLPDHGELWSAPWQELGPSSPTSLKLEARGTALPYLFRRHIWLREAEVVLDYEVQNTGHQDLPYLWSAHPLLQVAPGDRVVLPPEVTSVAVEWSARERIAGQVPWDQGLALLGPAERGWADKLFTGPLSQRWCQMAYSDGGSLTFDFASEEVSYLGLWICQGGWPTSANAPDRKRHYTVALEPCTAPCDRLDTALEQGHARTLRPDERVSWRLSLAVKPAPQDQTAAGGSP